MTEALAPSDRARALEVARGAAREAGDVLLSHLGRLDPGRLRRKSSARDLVTDADVASERLLVAHLRSAFPGHHIEAEEEVRDAGTERDGPPRWFLDPLDGTVNFVHRLPAFAVSIALWNAGAPEVAVVHAPYLGQTFWATRGGGAFECGPADDPVGTGTPMHASETGELGEAILASGFPYRRASLANPNLENWNRFFFDVRGMRRIGSAALDLAWVASGRLDGFWELHLSPHDVAAGGLLVREAGGRVQDAAGGEDWLRGGNIVATGPRLFEAVRSRVQV